MADLNEQVMKSTGRHLVTLSYILMPADNQKEYLKLISGFVVEVYGVWLYVTAGHVLREIQEWMATGAKLDVWRLSDYTAGGRFKNYGIPIHFDIDSWLILDDSEIGLDVAVLPIDDLYRNNLEAGGTIPIPDGAWRDEQIESAFWALVGVPYESVTYDGETIISARAVMVALEPADHSQIPSEPKQEKFYAHLHTDSAAVVDSVKGMSGGPIFAFMKSADDWGYVVIGVQSGWFPSSRIVSIFRFSVFADFLKKTLAASA